MPQRFRASPTCNSSSNTHSRLYLSIGWNKRGCWLYPVYCKQTKGVDSTLWHTNPPET
jgi:hypothetical protein